MLDPSRDALGDEGYELTVATAAVQITARTPAGVFYGVQTLRQLMPSSIEHQAPRPHPVSIPGARIEDRPRFVWRGAMLDVARHFFGPADVRRYIDLLALYKFNRLHLHLSDDQGWRLEIKSWPNLTAHGASTAVGGGPGGYYTQQDYTELIAYARDRFITVIPEIDMPSHINAALASVPELNCDGVAPPLYTGIEVGFSNFCVDKEITYKFIDDVVREIAGLTPAPYFHIGGDEVKKITPAQYRAFMERVQGIVASHGKTPIAWDEVAAATLLPSTIVQQWRPAGEVSGAAGYEGDPLAGAQDLSRHAVSHRNADRAALGRVHGRARGVSLGPRDGAARRQRGVDPRCRSATLVRDAGNHAGCGVHGLPPAGRRRRNRVVPEGEPDVGRVPRAASLPRPSAGPPSASTPTGPPPSPGVTENEIGRCFSFW